MIKREPPEGVCDKKSRAKKPRKPNRNWNQLIPLKKFTVAKLQRKIRMNATVWSLPNLDAKLNMTKAVKDTKTLFTASIAKATMFQLPKLGMYWKKAVGN